MVPAPVRSRGGGCFTGAGLGSAVTRMRRCTASWKRAPCHTWWPFPRDLRPVHSSPFGRSEWEGAEPVRLRILRCPFRGCIAASPLQERSADRRGLRRIQTRRTLSAEEPSPWRSACRTAGRLPVRRGVERLGRRPAIAAAGQSHYSGVVRRRDSLGTTRGSHGGGFPRHMESAVPFTASREGVDADRQLHTPKQGGRELSAHAELREDAPDISRRRGHARWRLVRG